MARSIGFGLAVGVLLDAFLVRMTFTPAVLSMLGDRAWWLPRWLDRLLPNLDVEGAALAERLAAQEHAAEPERELARVGELPPRRLSAQLRRSVWPVIREAELLARNSAASATASLDPLLRVRTSVPPATRLPPAGGGDGGVLAGQHRARCAGARS